MQNHWTWPNKIRVSFGFCRRCLGESKICALELFWLVKVTDAANQIGTVSIHCRFFITLQFIYWWKVILFPTKEKQQQTDYHSWWRSLVRVYYILIYHQTIHGWYTWFKGSNSTAFVSNTRRPQSSRNSSTTRTHKRKGSLFLHRGCGHDHSMWMCMSFLGNLMVAGVRTLWLWVWSPPVSLSPKITRFKQIIKQKIFSPHIKTKEHDMIVW